MSNNASSDIDRLRLPPELAARTLFLSRADRSVVEKVSAGVLFIMAFWSMPARLAFAELKEVLLAADRGGRLQLVVIDADGCPDTFHIDVFREPLRGCGETAWILNGKIVRTSGFGFNPECFADYTRLTLAELSDKKT